MRIDLLINEFPETDFLVADGFDSAIIGTDSERVIYSIYKCWDILEKEHNMTDNEAIEFFEFNVLQAYVGEKGPLFIYDYFN